ncbi:MAG: flagellin [Lachnospiraceae bacterium]|nr:flagellin [Lachnospiraceae bacterium]
MRINYNQSAILANSCLNRTDKNLSNSMERLSSGFKINHAKDNPAGYAISNRMSAQIGGLGVAKANTNDGISVVETADGAMSEISSMLQRMSELAVQAGTDTVSDDDRAVIDSEIQQLKKEITRIANDTEFNGQPLLNGNFDLKGYTDNENVKVSYYSEEVNVAKYDLDFAGLITNNGDGSYSVDNSILKTAFPGVEGLKSEYNGSILKITGDGNFDLRLDIKDGENFSEKVNIDITGIGAMKIQAGANEGQEISIRIQEISLKKFGLDDLKFTPDLDDDGNPIEGSSAANAQKGIAAIKDAMSYLSEARAKLGAYQNRMEHNTTNLDVSSENMTASYSRIMDVDMAEEMTIYSTQQILSQAGISMLSQANQLPEKVLQLLQ